MKFSVKLITTEKEIIATCPELDINCYGNDRDEAIRRIKKVIRFYIESAKELGLDVDSIDELSVDGEIKSNLHGNASTQNSTAIN